ncbi:uncharacterized protein TRAVEDRAFT_73793 [Trametes versicolor FP-101664 SS1]|uniref:uncharacterized protein n=1 Tax=Trametes versicolor (strain FP-101664) TaxID=717944 RepID=UPI0004623625|nr:uncharacterized protein TRAVEDRAFT_73793 [Trametes versicolor FP-101664 SS1]EIW56203.1 hypothetical protein TRAVEDRAFT_73793 [Trametes versicolor FP-101664 SS1]
MESGGRHPQLYFLDGDVVLGAPLLCSLDGKVDQYQLYRVHKAYLGHHSVFFANLFADGSAGLGPKYDGQPLVEVLDKAENFSRLLTYLYNPFGPLFKHWSPDAPMSLTPIIRLADKYLIESLRTALIEQVTSDWPCTLAAWDASEGEANAIRDTYKRSVVSNSHATRFADQIPEPASAIVFAREFACPEILPAVFYQLCRIGIKEEFEHRENYYPTRSGRLACWALLGREDLTRYLHGCDALETYCKELRRKFAEGDSVAEGCVPMWARPELGPTREDEKDRTGWPCYAFAERILQLAWPEDGEREPLEGLLKLLEYERLPDVRKDRPRGFCEDCDWGFHGWLRAERQMLWDRLPELFQLS